MAQEDDEGVVYGSSSSSGEWEGHGGEQSDRESSGELVVAFREAGITFASGSDDDDDDDGSDRGGDEEESEPEAEHTNGSDGEESSSGAISYASDESSSPPTSDSSESESESERESESESESERGSGSESEREDEDEDEDEDDGEISGTGESMPSDAISRVRMADAQMADAPTPHAIDASQDSHATDASPASRTPHAIDAPHASYASHESIGANGMDGKREQEEDSDASSCYGKIKNALEVLRMRSAEGGIFTKSYLDAMSVFGHFYYAIRSYVIKASAVTAPRKKFKAFAQENIFPLGMIIDSFTATRIPAKTDRTCAFTGNKGICEVAITLRRDYWFMPFHHGRQEMPDYPEEETRHVVVTLNHQWTWVIYAFALMFIVPMRVHGSDTIVLDASTASTVLGASGLSAALARRFVDVWRVAVPIMFSGRRQIEGLRACVRPEIKEAIVNPILAKTI